MEDFQLCKNDEGMEFVQFTEGPTKTRQGGLQSKNRDFQPRMFSVGGERCPVSLFKQFVERRPLNMRWSGTSVSKETEDWMTTSGSKLNQWAKTLSNIMKTTVAGTSLEESHKKFTNHSARKTIVSKLKKANAQIMWRSQATEAYNPLTITMKPTRKNNDDFPVQYPNEIMKTPVLRKSEWQFPTSQQLWLHSIAPVNTNVPVPHTLAGHRWQRRKKTNSRDRF